MDTNSLINDSSVKAVPCKAAPNLFKVLSTTKPVYTIHWIKYQVSLIDEHTSLSELTELLQHATLTLLRPNMTDKQTAKARQLMTTIAFNMAYKVTATND